MTPFLEKNMLPTRRPVATTLGFCYIFQRSPEGVRRAEKTP
jgi:hypothetical protein